MKRLLIGLSLIGLSACAQTTAKPVRYDDAGTPGVRVYDPLVLLVVTCSNTEVVVVPDLERGYAVDFRAVLAKNDVTIETREGLLTKLGSKLDTQGLLSLLQGVGEKAAGAAGELAALGASVGGTIPGMEGIWRLEVDPVGKLVGLTPVARAEGECGGVTSSTRTKAPAKR